MYLEVMQIRNVIPWIRSGPISVQDLSPGDLYVDYEGNPLSMFNCFSKKLYDIVSGMIDSNLKVHEKWKNDFPEDIFDLNERQKLYGMAFLARNACFVVTDNLVHFYHVSNCIQDSWWNKNMDKQCFGI